MWKPAQWYMSVIYMRLRQKDNGPRPALGKSVTLSEK
jgi:hypothetical protein